MRFERAISVLVLATGVTYGGVEAAENPAGQAKPEAAAGTPASPPPKFQQEVGTNPWVLAKPTPEHAILAGLSGKFTSKVHLYSGPYVRMLDTEGTAEGKPLMGGVFVQVTQSETRMKAQFDAITIFGFDEATPEVHGRFDRRHVVGDRFLQRDLRCREKTARPVRAFQRSEVASPFDRPESDHVRRCDDLDPRRVRLPQSRRPGNQGCDRHLQATVTDPGRGAKPRRP